MVSKLRLEDCVLFLGKMKRNSLLALYDEADVYASAAFSDGTSSSLIEAICRCLPVVVSNSSGNKEWMQDGVTGSMFDPESAEEMASKLLAVLKDPERFKHMAMAGKSNALQRAKWEYVSKHRCLLRMYLEVAESKLAKANTP